MKRGQSPTMGELNSHFEHAIFRALSAFAQWQNHPTCNFQRYQADLNSFIIHCADIRGTLDMKLYTEKLERFEEFVDNIYVDG